VIDYLELSRKKALGTDHEAIQISPAGTTVSIYDQVSNLFHIPYPESVTADFRRASRKRVFAVWSEIFKTGVLPHLTSQKFSCRSLDDRSS
jgi:hypothetical protein